MLYNTGYNQQVAPVESKLIWLDYLVQSNPHAVMQVLSKNGYSGYLAPQDKGELNEATYDFVEKKGDKAVVELLKVHPLYEIMVGISQEEKQSQTILPLKSTDNSEPSVLTTIKTFDYKKAAIDLLIVIGAIYVAGKVLGLLTR
jgi:hypothetical protein